MRSLCGVCLLVMFDNRTIVSVVQHSKQKIELWGEGEDECVQRTAYTSPITTRLFFLSLFCFYVSFVVSFPTGHSLKRIENAEDSFSRLFLPFPVRIETRFSEIGKAAFEKGPAMYVIAPRFGAARSGYFPPSLGGVKNRTQLNSWWLTGLSIAHHVFRDSYLPFMCRKRKTGNRKKTFKHRFVVERVVTRFPLLT